MADRWVREGRPEDLARRFPESDGIIFGAASNGIGADIWATTRTGIWSRPESALKPCAGSMVQDARPSVLP